MSNTDEVLGLWRTGRLVEALAAAEALRARSPGSALALNLVAALHIESGRPATALPYLREVAHLQPRDAAAQLRLADAERSAGDIPAAIGSHRRALEIEPHNTAARRNLGALLEQAGDDRGAALSYGETLALDASDATAHFNLGNVRLRGGDPAEALACYRRALALRPDFAGAWCNCAGVLLGMKQASEALECSERALALEPSLAAAWYTKAAALKELQRPEEALSACERALGLRAGYAEAHFVRAHVLRDLGEREGALAGFREALRLNPALEEARIDAVIAEIPLVAASAAEVLASRRAFEQALGALEADLERQPCSDPAAFVGAMQPFYLAYQEADIREPLARYGRICTSLMSRWRAGSSSTGGGIARAAAERVRIGVVCAYVGDHPVHDALTQGWLRQLDRRRFSLEVFHLGVTTDATTAAARAAADHFVHGPRSIGEWTQAVLERAPHTLLYPEIGMDQKTLQLACMRLAPVQVAAWGHPVTSGLPTIDYFLSAAALEPADAGAHYTEQLVTLPNLGVYYEPPAAAIGAEPAAATSARPSPMLLCPGTPFKYAPEHDWVLVEIARRIGPCQFHFFRHADGALSRRLLQRLGSAFSAAGLDPAAHLVLRPWASPGEFHGLLRSADLMLDTIGFSGFNTVMRALGCQLPVVSCRGHFLRGRLGSGILDLIGLSALVAASPQGYVDIAVSLARPCAERDELRERIAERVPSLYRDRTAIAALEAFLIKAAA